MKVKEQAGNEITKKRITTYNDHRKHLPILK